MYENAVLPLSSILKHDLSITPVHRHIFAYKCRNPLCSYDFNYYLITMVMICTSIYTFLGSLEILSGGRLMNVLKGNWVVRKGNIFQLGDA
jgi:hypothetical protein